MLIAISSSLLGIIAGILKKSNNYAYQLIEKELSKQQNKVFGKSKPCVEYVEAFYSAELKEKKIEFSDRIWKFSRNISIVILIICLIYFFTLKAILELLVSSNENFILLIDTEKYLDLLLPFVFCGIILLFHPKIVIKKRKNKGFKDIFQEKIMERIKKGFIRSLY